MGRRAKPQTAQTPAAPVGESSAGGSENSCGQKFAWKYFRSNSDHHWYLAGLHSCAAQVWRTDGGTWMGHVVPGRRSEQFATKRKAQIWCRSELLRLILADLKSLGVSLDELLRGGGFGEEITTELRRIAGLLSVSGMPDCQTISGFLKEGADRIKSESGDSPQRETEDVPCPY